MGITIHYRAKAKSKEAIEDLLVLLKALAENFNWAYQVIDEEIKGEIHPSWGYGFAFIPTKEQIKKQGIEYFPKMVSPKCNGYFRIFKGKYGQDVRDAFKEGRKPKFFADTRQKGIWVQVHPKCESLDFMFDLNTLELIRYERYEHSPKTIYAYEGSFCKTQFAGIKAHVLVCKLLKIAEHYLDFSYLDDEAGYYHSGDLAKARQYFQESEKRIKALKEELQKTGEKLGLKVATGEEI